MKLLLTVFLSFLASNALAEAIPNPEAVELGLHRIEKLVATKKIEESYQTKFSHATVSYMNHPGMEGFTVVISQVPGADNTAKAIEFLFDPNGLLKSYSLKAGTENMSGPVWSDQDAGSLAELPMHFLINTDNLSKHPDLMPYYRGMSEMTLNQQVDSGGNIFAAFQIKNTLDARILYMTFKADGSFVAYSIK